MAPTTASAELGLDVFQEHVVSTRNRSLGVNWKLDYSKFIQSEEIEFLTQHGPGPTLLLPESFGVNYEEATDSTKFGMADEIGDLIWFSVDAADRLGYSISEICSDQVQTLTEYESEKLSTFVELGNVAVAAAQKMKVPNKLGLMYPDEPSGYTCVADNPFYVFMRSSHRVRRSLDNGENDMSPPVASELEEIFSPDLTLSFNILVLAYISQARLGIKINDIANFTVEKLHNRELNGKENDIHFDETFISD